MDRRAAAKSVTSIVVSIFVLVLLSVPIGILPPLGGLANPGGGIWGVADQAEHPARLELSFPELRGTVTVQRDTLGIPHVFATNLHDVFSAQGFVTAQDRLFQMDMLRRVAKGELAEAFGPTAGGTDLVETDAFMRTIGLADLARRFWGGADPTSDESVAITAYAEGVNAYLRHAGVAGLPLEFKLLDYRPRPWAPEDSLSIGLFMAWSLSGTFEDAELALLADGLGAAAVDELFPILGPYQRPVDPRPSTRGGEGTPLGPLSRMALQDLVERKRAVDAFTGVGPLLGSNNWAVHGNLTDTQKPRLANDPHLQFTMPAIWYENHLVADGSGLDAYGVSFPGVPVVILGQNRRIAWGATNVGADVVDLYEETIDEDRYLFNGNWFDVVVRPETIHVKGRDAVSIEVRSTIHGPIVTAQGTEYAMRWTGQDAGNLLRAFYRIDFAQNWGEFRTALENFTVAAQNFVYADVDGNIAMRSNGLYPLREGFTGRYPLDGASGAYEWNDFVPFDEYPESVNPIEDFVLSANQQPQYDAYPYYLGWSWDPGYRARRINEMLENYTAGSRKVTEADFRAMQLDDVDVFARETTPLVLQAITGSCGDAVCSDALASLAVWDARMDEDAAAPAVWWRFANRFREEIFGDEWAQGGVTGHMLPFPNVIEYLLKQDPASAWVDDFATPAAETWQDIARRAFDEAVSELAAELGQNVAAWRWGDVNVREFPHLTGLEPLGRGPFAAGGDPLTVNPAAGDVATGGASWRLLADLSDLARSKGVYPGGQSGNPLSRHYDDLLQLWLAGDYHALRTPRTAADLAANVESTLILRGP